MKVRYVRRSAEKTVKMGPARPLAGHLLLRCRRHAPGTGMNTVDPLKALPKAFSGPNPWGWQVTVTGNTPRP